MKSAKEIVNGLERGRRIGRRRRRRKVVLRVDRRLGQQIQRKTNAFQFPFFLLLLEFKADFCFFLQNVLRELEQKKPQLDELVKTAENLRESPIKQQIPDKGKKSINAYIAKEKVARKAVVKPHLVHHPL